MYFNDRHLGYSQLSTQLWLLFNMGVCCVSLVYFLLFCPSLWPKKSLYTQPFMFYYVLSSWILYSKCCILATVGVLDQNWDSRILNRQHISSSLGHCLLTHMLEAFWFESNSQSNMSICILKLVYLNPSISSHLKSDTGLPGFYLRGWMVMIIYTGFLSLSVFLQSVIFIRDHNILGQEVSGYIDYAHRLKTQDFEPYFNGKKRLMPGRSDLW